MSDDSAAGRKTETDEQADLGARLMAGLEEHFHTCTQIIRQARDAVTQQNLYSLQDLKTAHQFMRTSAQLATTIARLSTLKSNGSNPK